MLALWTVGPFGRTLVVILVVASFRAVLILCGQYCSAAAFVFSDECVSAEVALLSSRAVVMLVTVLAQQRAVLVLVAVARKGSGWQQIRAVSALVFGLSPPTAMRMSLHALRLTVRELPANYLSAGASVVLIPKDFIIKRTSFYVCRRGVVLTDVSRRCLAAVIAEVHLLTGTGNAFQADSGPALAAEHVMKRCKLPLRQGAPYLED